MARMDTLFSDAEVKRPAAHPRRETKWIHYKNLVRNAKQYCDAPMEEIISLAYLIDAEGEVLQDLRVRKTDKEEYEIIAGHKRTLAVQYLVEEQGKEQYALLPCKVDNLSDVRAEFRVISTNGYHDKTDYEKMYEIERMKTLLEEHPEEFPHLQTGRMVERLAQQLNMKRSTVGEFLTISNNLSEKGREKFKSGELKKSAAVELASLPEEEQNRLIDNGVLQHKDVKEYKEIKKLEEVVSSPVIYPDILPGQLEVVNMDMEMEMVSVTKATSKTEERSITKVSHKPIKAPAVELSIYEEAELDIKHCKEGQPYNPEALNIAIKALEKQESLRQMIDKHKEMGYGSVTFGIAQLESFLA